MNTPLFIPKGNDTWLTIDGTPDFELGLFESEAGGLKRDTKDILADANTDDDKINATAAFTILALFATVAALVGFVKPILFTVGHAVAAVCGLIAMAIFISFVEEEVIDNFNVDRDNLEYDASFGLLVVSWLMNAAVAVLSILPATKPDTE